MMTGASLAALLVGLGGLALIAGGGDSDDGESGRIVNVEPDETEGGAGADELFSTQGDDVLNGRGGNDDMISWNGEDTLYGGVGDDLLMALDAREEFDTDTLFGGSGNDILWGENDDVLTGGSGTDAFVVGAFPEDQIDFGTSLDLSLAGFDFLEPEELDVSRITDFDADTESLELVADSSPTFANGFVSFEELSDGSGVRAGVSGLPDDDIIWLAAIEGVSVEEMEAARADGRVFGYR